MVYILLNYKSGELGQTVFVSKESAEQALTSPDFVLVERELEVVAEASVDAESAQPPADA